MIIVHACVMFIVHARIMIIVLAYSMIIVHAFIMIIIHVCITYDHRTTPCPIWLMFDELERGGSGGRNSLGKPALFLARHLRFSYCDDGEKQF